MRDRSTVIVFDDNTGGDPEYNQIIEFLEKQDISQLSESDLSQIRGKKIGFIFQTFNLINTLSAMENVTLPMVFQGTNKEDRLKRAEHLLNIVGLGFLIDLMNLLSNYGVSCN